MLSEKKSSKITALISSLPNAKRKEELDKLFIILTVFKTAMSSHIFSVEEMKKKNELGLKIKFLPELHHFHTHRYYCGHSFRLLKAAERNGFNSLVQIKTLASTFFD